VTAAATSPPTALVTGAHGFIGSHLVDALLARGARVRALVTPWGSLERLGGAADRIEVVRADITSDPLDEAIRDVEVVYHTAARVAEWGPDDPFVRTNVLGTERLVCAAEAGGVRRFVHVSTVAVHRYRGYRDADPREAPLDGDLNAYARSKAAAERVVAAAGELEWTIVRPGLWPIGPRDTTMPRLLGAMRSGLMPLVDGGRAALNTVAVANFVDALLLAATVPAAAGRVYLIADDGAPTWREALGEVAYQAGLAPRWLSLPGAMVAPVAAGVEGLWRMAAPQSPPPLSRYAAALMRRDLHFSDRHARDELGYRPRATWREGVRRAVEAAMRPP
jgi:2-alkyl-3-oxoalkanoate reductase